MDFKISPKSPGRDKSTLVPSSSKSKKKPWKHYGDRPISNIANVPTGWSDDKPDLDPE